MNPFAFGCRGHFSCPSLGWIWNSLRRQINYPAFCSTSTRNGALMDSCVPNCVNRQKWNLYISICGSPSPIVYTKMAKNKELFCVFDRWWLLSLGHGINKILGLARIFRPINLVGVRCSCCVHMRFLQSLLSNFSVVSRWICFLGLILMYDVGLCIQNKLSTERWIVCFQKLSLLFKSFFEFDASDVGAFYFGMAHSLKRMFLTC